MKEWRNVIESQTNTLMGWALYVGDKQLAIVYPVANDPNHFFKVTASFDRHHYCSHGLSAETLNGAKEEVENLLIEEYLKVVDHHTKIVKEYSSYVQNLTSETN